MPIDLEITAMLLLDLQLGECPNVRNWRQLLGLRDGSA